MSQVQTSQTEDKTQTAEPAEPISAWGHSNELDRLFEEINACLHGAWASAEFFSDTGVEITLVILAKEKAEEAKEFASELCHAYSELNKALVKH